MKYVTVTLNPTVDRMYRLSVPFKTGGLNRTEEMSEISYSGKGINVSRELKNLGVNSDMMCILRGSVGEEAYKSFIEEGLSPVEIKTSGRLRTNISIIDSEGLDTEINECGEPLEFDAVLKFLALYDKTISSDEKKVVVVSGSTPPGFRNDIYKMLIFNAKKNNSYTVLDADGELLKQGLEAGPSLIKPNEHELSLLTGCALEGSENEVRLKALAAASAIYEKTGVEVLCTLGSKGSIFVGEEGQFVCPAKKANIKRFKGAGDMFLARFLFERFENKRSIFDAMRIASDKTAENLEK
ncbi:MAG: 1-phosphofructokinase [Ruminococcaceae bacterium]|nr:1-phosphofructokinase [Oscillospiraceae bacterium]